MSFTRFHDDPCRIQKYLEDSELIKEIYVPNKIVNLVVKNK